MSWANTQHYRHDFARAKLLGIDPTQRGWRKQLKQLPPPTEPEVQAVQAAVTKRDHAVRLSRLMRTCTKGCPHELHPEFQIVGELYLRLRQAGLCAHLEVTVPSEFHDSGVMRVDIGIVNYGGLVYVIECKREGRGLSKNTQQAKAYRALRERYGVELGFANRMSDLDALVAKCKSYVLSLR